MTWKNTLPSVKVIFPDKHIRQPRSFKNVSSRGQFYTQIWTWSFNDTVELVSYLVQEEVSAKDATLRETGLNKAKFPSLKTIDGFNFPLQPTVDESKIRALANLDFLRSAQNVLFLKN